MDLEQQSNQTTLFSWRWNAKSLCFAIIFIPITLSLSFWQLQRADEKEQILSAQQRRIDTPAVDIRTVLAEPENQFRNVMAVGVIDNEKIFLLDNRVRHGRIGYDVLVLMAMDDINSSQWLLVNRGWLPGNVDRSVLPIVPPIVQAQNIAAIYGYLYRSPGKPLILKEQIWRKDHWPLVIQAIDMDKISHHLGLSIYPYTLRLTEGPAIDDDNAHSQNKPLETGWLIINSSPEKHIGYAVQWLLMAVALLVMTIFANSNLAGVLNRSKREF